MENNDNNNYFLQILSKLDDISNRIENIEKTYVSMNTDLINQNIRMSEIVNGKLQEPESPVSNEINKTSDNSNVSNANNASNVSNTSNASNEFKKELFYYENNGKIIVHGPGTYDNRPILRQYGEWNSANKTWDLVCTIDVLKEKLPNIIEKEKNLFISE